MSVQTIESELFVELSAQQQQFLSGGQTTDEGQSDSDGPSSEGESFGRRKCPRYYYCGGYYYYPRRRHGGGY